MEPTQLELLDKLAKKIEAEQKKGIKSNTLVNAGILTKNGKFTKTYSCLNNHTF